MVDRVALDVFTEGLAQLLRGRPFVVVAAGAFGGAHVLGRGVGLQRLAQHGGLGRGHGEAAVGESLAVLPEAEPGLLACAGFLLLQEARLVLVGTGGVDDLHDPATEGRELRGVEVAGPVDQVALGTVTIGGCLVVEVIDGLGDDQGLLGVESTPGHRGPGRLVGGEGMSESGLAAGLGPGELGVTSQPDFQRPDPLGTGEVEGLGLVQGACLELGQPGQISLQPSDDRSGVGGVQRPGRGLGDLVETPFEPVEEPDDRMARSGLVEVPTHAISQALTTDIPGENSAQPQGLWRTLQSLALCMTRGLVGAEAANRHTTYSDRMDDHLAPGCFACRQHAEADLPPREEILHTEHWRVAHAFNSPARVADRAPDPAPDLVHRVVAGGRRRAGRTPAPPRARTGVGHQVREDLPDAVLRGRGL